MIWSDRLDGVPLSQGDVFDSCPVFDWSESGQGRELIER